MVLTANTYLKPVPTAVRRGIKRLLANLVDGHWHGFPTLAGESDIWVTGFILAHIRGLVKQIGIIDQARCYLLDARHATGGWSYNLETPPDADSTAWCLIALRNTKKLSTKARHAAETFVWSYQTGEGIATFQSGAGIEQYIQAEEDRLVSGWTMAHQDVTAAAVLATRPGTQHQDVEETLGYLIGQQRGSGFFDAYWWRGPHYTTTLVLRALMQHRRRLSISQARLLLNALRREQLADGGFGLGASQQLDPFTTALALESLCYLSYLGGARERRAAGAALLKAQQTDGGWKGDYVMRLPAPDVIDPRHVNAWTRDGRGGNSYILDRSGLFATALACFSLDYWRKIETGTLVPRVSQWPTVKPQRDSLSDDLTEITVKTS